MAKSKESVDKPGKKKGSAGKVFINGAGGFVGRHVVEEAVAAGWKVVANDLPGKDLGYAEALGAEVRLGDLTDYSFVEGAIADCERIINVAGLFVMALPYDTLYSANVQVSLNMSRAAAAKGDVKRFVHIASMAVYGRPDSIPLVEDCPKHPRNNYERTKKMGEDAVFDAHRKEGLPVCSLRPGAVYGPWSRYGEATVMTSMLMLSRTPARYIPLPTRGLYFHIVHVRDLARASVFLLDAEGVEGKAFNCGEERPSTLEEQINAFLAPYGRKMKAFKWFPLLGKVFSIAARLPEWPYAPVNWVLAWLWKGPVRREGLSPGFTPSIDSDALDYFTSQHEMDVSRLRDAGFVFNYPDSREGLQETVKWYIDNKWLPARI